MQRPPRVSGARTTRRRGRRRALRRRGTDERSGSRAAASSPTALPDPGLFRAVARARRGARIRLDLGRRASLVPEPHPRPRRRACHVRRRHEPDHARRRRRPAPAPPAEPRREAGRVARLRLRWPARCSGVGVGGEGPQDFEAAGVPDRRSAARGRTRRSLALRELFADAPASFTGPLLPLRGRLHRAAPRSARRAAAPRRRALGRSACGAPARLGDGWLPYLVSPERYAAGWRRSTGTRSRAGRDPDAAASSGRRTLRSCRRRRRHGRGRRCARTSRSVRHARSSRTTWSASASPAPPRSALRAYRPTQPRASSTSRSTRPSRATASSSRSSGSATRSPSA